MANKADIVLRFLAKDEGVRDALSGMGKDGKKALRDIDRAAKGAKPGLKAVDNVVNDIKSSTDGMVNRLGPAGSLLKGLGPIGIAAGAGLGAALLGAQQLGAAGERAILTLAEMSRAAEKLELDPEQFQALRLELERLGISTEKTDMAFATAQKTLSEATLGTGEFYSALKLINPELVKQVRLARTTSERLDLIKTAYRDAGTEAERNTILVRTFGDGNVEAGQRLLQMEGSLDATTQAYKDQGLVIGKDLLPRYEEMAQEITANSQKAEAAALRLTSRLAELGLSGSQLKANFANSFASLFPPRDLDEEIVNLTAKVERLQGIAERPGAGFWFAGSIQAAKDAQIELDALLAKRDRLAQSDAIIGSQFVGAAPASPDVDPVLTEREKAAALKRQNELNAARSRAARVLADLGDVTGLVAEKQKGLEELYDRGLISAAQRDEALRRYEEQLHSQSAAVRALAEAEKRAAEVRLSVASEAEAITLKVAARAKELAEAQRAQIAGGSELVLTQDEIAASLRRYREELDGTKAAKDELAQAVIQTLDPMERLARDTAELERMQALANIPAAEFNRILEQRRKLATDETEIDRFGETLDDAEERIREAAMTAEAVIAAKVEAERQILEALGDRLTDVDTEAYLAKYAQGLKDAADAGRDFRGVNDLIGDGIRGNIRSMKDFGDAALNILADIITKALESSDALGGIFGSGGFGQAVGDIIGSVFHDGTSNAAQPKRTRRLSAGSKLGHDEHVTVLRSRERVFSESDNRALINAVNGAGRTSVIIRPPDPVPTFDYVKLDQARQRIAVTAQSSNFAVEAPLQVNVYNSTGEPVETKERRNGKGERELLVMVGKQAEKAAAKHIASPRGKAQMRQIYGLKPKALGGGA